MCVDVESVPWEDRVSVAGYDYNDFVLHSMLRNDIKFISFSLSDKHPLAAIWMKTESLEIMNGNFCVNSRE